MTQYLSDKFKVLSLISIILVLYYISTLDFMTIPMKYKEWYSTLICRVLLVE